MHPGPRESLGSFTARLPFLLSRRRRRRQAGIYLYFGSSLSSLMPCMPMNAMMMMMGWVWIVEALLHISFRDTYLSKLLLLLLQRLLILLLWWPPRRLQVIEQSSSWLSSPATLINPCQMSRSIGNGRGECKSHIKRGRHSSTSFRLLLITATQILWPIISQQQ